MSAVNRIIQAYRSEDGRLKDAARPGRSRCTLEESDRLIVAAAVADPFQSAQQIKTALDLQVGVETIRRRLREAGLHGFIAAQKPHLTERQRRQRLEFARAHEHWTVEDWEEVIFSDESTFCSRWDQELHVWRPYKCRYDPGYISEVHSSGRCAVNVWGAVSKDGLGPLVRLSRSFTAGAYCEILDSHLLPYALDGPFKDGCFWFQQDLSPVHTARAVRNLLEERDASADELWFAIAGEWQRLGEKKDFIESLYESLPRRMQAAIRVDGACTRY
ncbi:hypothetical protein HPB52_015220 [Rhipicephalus sanguineus]|uniref:Transposase Tc1-like domain-containing protein n=1 Tax=Rhipicephalus sanguineus TaxID=34632 RepID=A0A9D4PNG4_RHISA|nr:hypothetical protein HPB52_015220 [Rhipicephalus sanguineus]